VTSLPSPSLLRNVRRRMPRVVPVALAAVLGLLSALPASAEKVRLSTSAGDIVLELAADKAPKTVANFVDYVKAGHYNGTVFHRVINGFMIQGGGMTADLNEKPTRQPIALESGNGLSNLRGTVAMARTSFPNSATSQFFINVNDNPNLDRAPGSDGYAVFGKVVEGMDVVDKIKAVPTTSRGMYRDVPVEPIVIKKASLEK
jgi:peptidyl-prolyl cis-trans isomerase A (cyclophilin A)